MTPDPTRISREIGRGETQQYLPSCYSIVIDQGPLASTFSR